MKQTSDSSISSAGPLSNIRIVLVETSHPGNIGAAARAMKNMCLEQLYLVRPAAFPDEQATARASGAGDLLERAVVCDSLEEAIADCRLVIATSARKRSTPWPVLAAEEAAVELVSLARQAPVALVFGREKSGLNNAELDHCHRMVCLPANPDFSSLNLAAAVQVLSYEIRQAQQAEVVSEPVLPALRDDDLPASSANLQRLFEHLEQVLLGAHFMPLHRAPTLMRKLMRFYYRSGITEEEVRIFRGILSEMQRLANARDECQDCE